MYEEGEQVKEDVDDGKDVDDWEEADRAFFDEGNDLDD